MVYKRPTHLQDMLVHSELNRKINSGSVSKYIGLAVRIVQALWSQIHFLARQRLLPLMYEIFFHALRQM